MRPKLLLALVLSASSAFLPVAARAAEADGEAKLREALRNSMLQLRNAETERSTLQTAQAQLADENKALKEQIELLKKHATTDRAAAEKTVATLIEKSAAQATEIAQLQVDLAKSKGATAQSSALATAKETDRAKLAAEIIVLERKVADREAKNLALFKIGNEILTRYEKFSLGEALAAREPFVGATRARLETLVQDYADKLTDSKVKP
jgi:hypothetical protein